MTASAFRFQNLAWDIVPGLGIARDFSMFKQDMVFV